MRGEATAKYAPALRTAPLGALDPVYAAIAFGMVTGWLAIVGVMVEQQRPAREIRRALLVSLLIGGGGALFAAFAVSRLHADPLMRRSWRSAGCAPSRPSPASSSTP